MNWGGLFSRSDKGSGASRIQTATPLQQQRLKQISSLRVFHQRVTEVKRDSQYKIDFQVAGDDLSLTVVLPDDFPNEKPRVMVSPRVQHVWVDDNMCVIGCTALNNFYMHSDLGKVLHIIVKEFQDHPPFILRNQEPVPASSRQETSMYSVASSTFYTQRNELALEGPLISVDTDTETVSTLIPKPEVQPLSGIVPGVHTEDTEIFSRLSSLSTAQLQELNDNPEAFLNEISSMAFISKLQEERESLFKENEESARHNISLKPLLESKKDCLRQAYEKHIQLKQEHETLQERQNEHKEIFSLGNIITNLSICAMQAEEDSEKIAENFLNGQLPVDEFLKDFLEQRKICHMRKAKEEKARSALQGS